MIPENAKALFDSQSLVAFATASKSGEPNAVPIYWKKIVDGKTIWLLDNFMKQTRQNLVENPKVCISFWDSKTEEGYKLKGTASYHASGKPYDEATAWMQSKSPGRKPRGVVVVKIEKAYSIAPGEKAGELLE